MKIIITTFILFSSSVFAQEGSFLNRNVFKSFTLQQPVALEKPIEIIRNGTTATWTNLRNTIYGQGRWFNERQDSHTRKCMMKIYGRQTQTLAPGSVFMVANMQVDSSYEPQWLEINLNGSNVSNVSMNIRCVDTGSMNVGWNMLREYFTGIGQFELNQ